MGSIDDSQAMFARRELLIGGMALAALLALPRIAHAAPLAGDASTIEVRALLRRASRTAFTDLAKPDGFWDSPVARISLPVLFDARAPGAGKPHSRDELQHRLNTIAQHVLPRASATVDQSIARLGSTRALPALGNEPTASTTLLRRATGARLVNAMIPVLARALREHDDPVIRQAMQGLKGVTTTDVAHALANETDNAIWYAIGAGEAAARRG
uniref:DUF4197 family protein n=1 Tax=uncultured Sphingomonas sp. TaxID=158754 RepID=UPI0035CB8660